jgi:hypothetical protein
MPIPANLRRTHHSDCFFNLIEVDLYLTHKTPEISRRTLTESQVQVLL